MAERYSAASWFTAGTLSLAISIGRFVPDSPPILRAIARQYFQFASAVDLRMRGQDLLDQRCARTRHSDDEDWAGVGMGCAGEGSYCFGSKRLNSSRHGVGVIAIVEIRHEEFAGLANLGERFIETSKPFENSGEGKQQSGTFDRGNRISRQVTQRPLACLGLAIDPRRNLQVKDYCALGQRGIVEQGPQLVPMHPWRLHFRREQTRGTARFPDRPALNALPGRCA